MRTLPLVALVVLAFAAAPAAAQTPRGDPDPSIADGSALAALQQARERWAATGIRSYRFRLRVMCFCGTLTTRPATVTVRRGKPVDAPKRLRAVATVPRLFAQVRKAIDRKVEGLDVVYGRRGVPRQIAIDVSELIADEEIGYSATRLKPLGK